ATSWRSSTSTPAGRFRSIATSSIRGWLRETRTGARHGYAFVTSFELEVELRPRRPPVVRLGDERVVVDLLRAATIAVLDEPVGRGELDRDFGRAARVVRFHGGEIA